MENDDVVAALAALAHATRLEVFRRLVRAGVDGVAAGEVSAELEIPPATLSFHLKALRSARLVTSEREGRVIRYAPDFGVIAEVVGYLGENCCRDSGGCDGSAVGPSRIRSKARPTRTKRPTGRRRGGTR